MHEVKKRIFPRLGLIRTQEAWISLTKTDAPNAGFHMIAAIAEKNVQRS